MAMIFYKNGNFKKVTAKDLQDLISTPTIKSLIKTYMYLK